MVFFATYSGKGLSGLPGGGAKETSPNVIGTRTLPAFLMLAARRTSLLSAVDASARILPISATSPGGCAACAAGVAPPIGETPGTSGAIAPG